MAAPLSVKGIFTCRLVLVSLAIFQVWFKVINEVNVQVVKLVAKKGLDCCPCFPVVAASHLGKLLTRRMETT